MSSLRRCLPLTLALLTGCAAPATMPGGSWSLDRQSDGSAAVAPPPAAVSAPVTAARTAPADPAVAALVEAVAPAATAPARRGGGGSGGGSAGVAPTSRLTVDLRGFLGGLPALRARRLLATVDDVAKVVVTVYQPGQPDRVVTVTQAQIAAGVAEVTFPELALGNAIVFAVAYDAAEVPIGSAAQVVVVRADGAATADLPMRLVPAGAAGAGSGGTLVARASFLDGPVPEVPTGTVLTEIRMTDGPAVDLEPGEGGEMYVVGLMVAPGTSASQQLGGKSVGGIARFGPDGELLFRAGYATARWVGRVRRDPAGGLWALPWGGYIPAAKLAGPPANLNTLGQAHAVRNGAAAIGPGGDLYYVDAAADGRPIHRISPAGVDAATAMAGFSAIAFDAAGNLWTNVEAAPYVEAEAVRRYGPDGALLGTYPVPGRVANVWAAPDGSAWIAHGEPGGTATGASLRAPMLTHMAADGAILATVALPNRDVAIDRAGNAWVVGAALTKLSPAGATLGSWASPGTTVAVASDGMVWADGDFGLIRRIQP